MLSRLLQVQKAKPPMVSILFGISRCVKVRPDLIFAALKVSPISVTAAASYLNILYISEVLKFGVLDLVYTYSKIINSYIHSNPELPNSEHTRTSIIGSTNTQQY